MNDKAYRSPVLAEVACELNLSIEVSRGHRRPDASDGLEEVFGRYIRGLELGRLNLEESHIDTAWV